MESSAFERYWWEKITSASSFVQAAVTALRECKTPVLLVPNDLPWRDAMRFVMQNSITGDCENLVPVTIDVHDENKEGCEPGLFLLHRLNDNRYRWGSNLTIQQHILDNDLMRRKLLWIKGLSEGNADQWLDFCNGFDITQRDRGMIVIEMPFNKDLACYENLRAVQYESLIRSYSVQLFIEYVLDGKDYNKRWRSYLSMLIATLCNKDVEIACILANEFDLKTCRIDEALRAISRNPKYEKRGHSEKHILNLIRNKKNDQINKLIWTAQIQVLFPMMEFERIKWVERYFDKIQQVIDERGITAVGDNTMIHNPYEAEFKQLHNSYKDGDLEKEPDSKRQARLKLMYDCRNDLAHLRICKHENVFSLLNSDFKDFV